MLKEKVKFDERIAQDKAIRNSEEWKKSIDKVERKKYADAWKEQFEHVNKEFMEKPAVEE